MESKGPRDFLSWLFVVFGAKNPCNYLHCKKKSGGHPWGTPHTPPRVQEFSNIPRKEHTKTTPCPNSLWFGSLFIWGLLWGCLGCATQGYVGVLLEKTSFAQRDVDVFVFFLTKVTSKGLEDKPITSKNHPLTRWARKGFITISRFHAQTFNVWYLPTFTIEMNQMYVDMVHGISYGFFQVKACSAKAFF